MSKEVTAKAVQDAILEHLCPVVCVRKDSLACPLVSRRCKAAVCVAIAQGFKADIGCFQIASGRLGSRHSEYIMARVRVV
eukprot:2429865-Amphidinium_carterae.1